MRQTKKCEFDGLWRSRRTDKKEFQTRWIRETGSISERECDRVRARTHTIAHIRWAVTSLVFVGGKEEENAKTCELVCSLFLLFGYRFAHLVFEQVTDWLVYCLFHHFSWYSWFVSVVWFHSSFSVCIHRMITFFYLSNEIRTLKPTPAHAHVTASTSNNNPEMFHSYTLAHANFFAND